jgi:hypothetical protein
MRDLSGFVTRARIIQPKCRPVTLLVRGKNDATTNQAYANCYIRPVDDKSGFEAGEGPADEEAIAVFYQEGEAVAPSVDDTILDSDGNKWLILKIGRPLVGFRANYGKHRCTVRRTL